MSLCVSRPIIVFPPLLWTSRCKLFIDEHLCGDLVDLLVTAMHALLSVLLNHLRYTLQLILKAVQLSYSLPVDLWQVRNSLSPFCITLFGLLKGSVLLHGLFSEQKPINRLFLNLSLIINFYGWSRLS